MQLSYASVCGLLLLFNLQLMASYPISPGLSDTDMDILKVILHRLEESVSEQAAVDPAERAAVDPAERAGADVEEAAAEADVRQPQTDLDEEMIREFLSAKNLKSVRNDSTRKSSGCFGRRMDRIGSMSSLGCNAVGKYNPK